MKVVLAEKPSVARDIATVLGATVKKEGYFEGGLEPMNFFEPAEPAKFEKRQSPIVPMLDLP